MTLDDLKRNIETLGQVDVPLHLPYTREGVGNYHWQTGFKVLHCAGKTVLMGVLELGWVEVIFTFVIHEVLICLQVNEERITDPSSERGLSATRKSTNQDESGFHVVLLSWTLL